MQVKGEITQRGHGVRRYLPVAALLLFATSALALVFRPHTIHGTVVDAIGPVAGATVRLRGSLDNSTTDAQGRFMLHFRGPALHRVVTAWKEGYYPAGADLSTGLRGFGDPSTGSLASSGQDGAGQALEGIALFLKPHPTADDPTYQWLTSHPNPNQALGCGHCMTAYDEWKVDAHALAATNPRFLSVYNGSDLAGQPAGGPGFRLDSPADPGNCANCHAPAAALTRSGAADMNRLSGVETEGVPCDLCHKIGDVTLDASTGLPHHSLPGVQSFHLYRPAAGTQIFFGTLDDIPRRVSYSALEKESRFCAPCHSGGWWGVSAYASYDEWLASPYAAEGVTCQACHMPSSGKTSTLTSPCAPVKPDPTEPALPSPGRTRPGSLSKGLVNLPDLLCRVCACIECHRRPAGDSARNPLPDFTLIPDRPTETIHTHRMTGIGDAAFMRSSIAMTITAIQGPDGVLVAVAITNVGAGHHIPTDSPMRNMILVVTARDAQGNSLPYLGTQVVPDWGGNNPEIPNPQSPTPNYAGLPGKGFAKVLEDWDGAAPAPQWRNGVRIQSDNRIPARATDVSQYTFALPQAVDGIGPPQPEKAPQGQEKAAEVASQIQPSGSQPLVTISARLIFRRAFKPWMDAKGWNEPDLILAETTVEAASADQAVLATLPQPRAMPLFPPSLATTATGERLASTDFAAPQECAACHPTAGQTWQASGHAVATTSPLYRAWFKAADQTTQGQISPFCAGCHTPIGLLSGQIRSRWAWPGRELHPLDAQAQTGVSCAVCHSLTETSVGNAAYAVTPNLASRTQHATRNTHYALRTTQFCAPCHEATNSVTGLPVMTTYSEWRASRFNSGDPATTTTCQDCHFADGRHGTLRMADLQQAARLEILAPTEIAPGEEITVQVRITNVGAGHDLPTGAAELRQMWLEVIVTDAAGHFVFVSGQLDEYGDPVEDTITYGTTWRDAAGNPTDRLWEAVSLLRDYRIPAGSSTTESYCFLIPAATGGPLHVRTALKYRAASGYLSALMTIYLQDKVASQSAIEIATAEISLPLLTRQP